MRTPPSAVQLELIPGAKLGVIPSALAPMLPTLTATPFSHPDWVYEPKLDGVRTLALIEQGNVRLLSRNGLDATTRYPGVVSELEAYPAHDVVLDGEVVALDDAGRPSFHRIQQRINLARAHDIRRADTQIPLVFYVFDLLHFDGYDLRGAPLERRKELLEQVLVPLERVQQLASFDEVGELAYQFALEHGFEGIVAKRRGSRYETGKRSRAWLKVKGTRSDDFVIGGYSEGQGSRSDTFGALVVGSYDDAGALRYAAHVGSGFDQRLLRDLRQRLDAIRVETSPFAERVPVHGRTTWVRPSLVAEVKYAEWTPVGSLRAPVFVRLREDKAAAEAHLPKMAPAPKVAPGRQLQLPEMDAVAQVLRQLGGSASKMDLVVEGHVLAVTNLDKELWPAVDGSPVLTKRDYLIYLAQVSRWLLPHLRDRPLTLIRLPNGIKGTRFFQKHAGQEPAFLETVSLDSKQASAEHEYLLCNNLASLLWVGQVAGLELHTSYARITPETDAAALVRANDASPANTLFDYPDFLVFDLDPYIYSGQEAKGAEPELNRAAFARTGDVALWLKDALDSVSLPSFVKTTGRTGLHMFVPVQRQFPYETIRALAGTFASNLVKFHPDVAMTEWSVSKRGGKIFIDVNQNVRAKTVASIFSPRAVPEAAVSMPLRWDEVGKVYPTDFTMRTALARLHDVGDTWAGILEAKADLRARLGLR